MCIFCEIGKGNIPAKKVYEDEKYLAFLDLSQTTIGHTLVIPKKHSKNIFELDEDSLDIMSAVKKVALILKKTFNPIGINIVSNNERPLQSVEHFHIHLIPRYENDNFDIMFKDNSKSVDLDEIIGKIKENL